MCRAKCESKLIEITVVRSRRRIITVVRSKSPNLGRDNRWIFVMRNSQRVMVLCNDQAYYTDIYGEGILHLGDDCSVEHSSFHIDAQSKFTGNRGELILPTLKRFVHFNVIHSKMNGNSYEKFVHDNFTSLYTMLESVKKQSELPNDLNYHDLHHYTLIYVIIFLLIIYFVSYYILLS